MTQDAKNRNLPSRVRVAWSGVRLAWRRERSVRTQVWIALALGAALTALRPAPEWWAISGLAVALVLSAELMNSSLEALIDHLHPQTHPGIRRAKDIAAGSVLVAGVAALGVGGLLLLSHL